MKENGDLKLLLKDVLRNDLCPALLGRVRRLLKDISIMKKDYLFCGFREILRRMRMMLRKKTMLKKEAAGEWPSSWPRQLTRMMSKINTFKYRRPAGHTHLHLPPQLILYSRFFLCLLPTLSPPCSWHCPLPTPDTVPSLLPTLTPRFLPFSFLHLYHTPLPYFRSSHMLHTNVSYIVPCTLLTPASGIIPSFATTHASYITLYTRVPDLLPTPVLHIYLWHQIIKHLLYPRLLHSCFLPLVFSLYSQTCYLLFLFIAVAFSCTFNLLFTSGTYICPSLLLF